jgi:hypothetical protein
MRNTLNTKKMKEKENSEDYEENDEHWAGEHEKKRNTRRETSGK